MAVAKVQTDQLVERLVGLYYVANPTGAYRGRSNGLTPFCIEILYINLIGTSLSRIDTP